MRLLRIVFAVSVACFFVGVKAAFGDIYVQNHSSLSDTQVQNALPAFQAAVDEDFYPYWGSSAKLTYGTGPPGSWNIELVDKTDVAGAAGYHTLKANVPYAMVGTREGLSWQLVFSHELFEMLADPFINRASFVWQCSIQLGCLSYTFYLVEVCDPVEWTHLAYNRPGADGLPVIISDFVTNNWYSGQTGRMDFMGYVHHHHQLLKHGYAAINQQGVWSNLFYHGAPTVFYRKP